MYFSRFCINFFQCKTLPSKHFNFVSTLSFCYCNVATWDNVKTMCNQSCVFQCWNLQCRTTSNQPLYFNVDMNNVRQSRNSVFIFNFEFHSVGKRQKNVVKMTLSKKNSNKYGYKYSNISLISKEDVGQVARVKFAGKSFGSIARFASKFLQCFKHAYIFFYLGFSLSCLVCLFLWFTE